MALGTIADVVPLVGENRILVSAGLERLNATTRPGLLALKQVAETPALLGVHEVGFQLGPRLNAAGRLETAEEALKLLLAGDIGAAMPLALGLDARNRERQQIERAMVEEVGEVVRARFPAGPGFRHRGGPVILAHRRGRHCGFKNPPAVLPSDHHHWRGRRVVAGVGSEHCGVRPRGPLCANAATCSLATAVTQWPPDWLSTPRTWTASARA